MEHQDTRMEAWEETIDKTNTAMDKVTQFHKESTHKTESFSKLQMKLESLSKELSNMQNVLVKREELDQQILSINEKLHDL